MTTVLPNLSLNLNKEFKNENKNENINNISNTIIINKEPVATLTTSSTNSLDLIKPISIEKSNTPEIIKGIQGVSPQDYLGLLQERAHPIK
jgi:hypothetical protein